MERRNNRTNVLHRDAVRCLGSIGPAAMAAIPVLRNSMSEFTFDFVDNLFIYLALWQITKDQNTLDSLLQHAMKPRRGSDEPAAANALVEVGPEVIPVLMAYRNKFGLTAEQRSRLTRYIHMFGKLAIPELIQDFIKAGQGKYLSREMENSLALFGPEVADELEKLLHHESFYVYTSAAKTLKLLGPAVYRKLIHALDDPRTHNRVASSLTSISPEDKPTLLVAVPYLIDALRQTNPNVRRTAARTLGKFGSIASEAIPELRTASRDSDETVGVWAYSALWQIGKDENAMSEWRKLLVGHAKRDVRFEAAMAFGVLGSDTKHAGRTRLRRPGG